jgi:ferrous iron transport protein A
MNAEPPEFVLKDIKKGMTVLIRRVEDKAVRTQLIRFGIGEGSVATCHERIPFGPIVLKHHRQEVAIGRELAAAIWVQEVQSSRT